MPAEKLALDLFEILGGAATFCDDIGIVPEAQYKIQSFSELVTKRVAETYFRGLI